MLLRDESPGAALGLWLGPIPDAGAMDAGYGDHGGDASEGFDDAGCWLHTPVVANIATNGKRNVAKSPTDCRRPGSVDRYMLDQWLSEAMAHWGKGQAELARQLAARHVIDNDRSIINKMLKGRRGIKANELLAIVDITGYPPPHDFLAIRVPVISWVNAGALASPEEPLDIDGAETVAVGGIDPGDWFALKVEGDSMDRISPPGSVILVNRNDRRLVSNACYIIGEPDGTSTYKRYRADPMRFEPVSTKQGHETLFPVDEPVIIGRVRRTILDM